MSTELAHRTVEGVLPPVPSRRPAALSRPSGVARFLPPTGGTEHARHFNQRSGLHLDTPGQRGYSPPEDLAGWTRLASTRGHQASGYFSLLSGQAAMGAHGGHFLRLDALAARLGSVRHVASRHSYLHAPSGLTFAVYPSAPGSVTLLLEGVNSSHSEVQEQTVAAEVKQIEASVLNLTGRVPHLHRTADLTVSGHSLGGRLAQYAGLINGLRVLAFSPVALGRGVLALLSQMGRLTDSPRLQEQVQSVSLEGIGTRWFRSSGVGLRLRLPLFPGLPQTRHTTSHGRIYSHLLAHLQRRWPELPSALDGEQAAASEEQPGFSSPDRH